MALGLTERGGASLSGLRRAPTRPNHRLSDDELAQVANNNLKKESQGEFCVQISPGSV